jgi:putative inorganic carbon (HCO3(-)) transporter
VFFYNFGLEGYIGYGLYATMWCIVLASMFRSPAYGIYYLTLLIPLQTIRYRLNAYPLGSNMITIVLLAVIIGALRRRREFPTSRMFNGVVGTYVVFTFLSLCLGGTEFEARFADWRSYVTMIVLLFVTRAAVTTRAEMRNVVLIMCFSCFLMDKSFWGTVSGRDFSAYSDDLRDNGAMGYAGVNGLAAFEAQMSTVLLVLAGSERKAVLRLSFYALAVFSVVCLMYSLSRAGYAAFLLGWLFLGVVRERKLLALLILFGLTWTAVVPPAVRDRVLMTYNTNGGELDHSSETRVTLWEDAMTIFSSSPIVGTGFNTYAYMSRVGNYRDTHNIYVKVLVETGGVGILLFLILMFRLWQGGLQLYMATDDPFLASLGLGLACWIVCAVAANFFGDRWTFLQVNGYMWILAGLVARAYSLIGPDGEISESKEGEFEDTVGDEATAVAENDLAPAFQPILVAPLCG